MTSEAPAASARVPDLVILSPHLDDAVLSLRERKLAAIAEYASQVRAFGGIERVRTFVRRGHRMLGGEPVWSCRPRSPR